MKKFTKCTASALAVLMAAAAFAAAPVSAAGVVNAKVTVKNDAKGVKISWKKADGAQKYVVSRKEGKGAYKTLGTVAAGGKLAYTDKSAKAGKKYTYSVKSVNGYATASSEKSIVRLKAPTAVKVKQNADYGRNKITYKKSKGAKKYEIYRAKVSGSKTGKFKKLGSTKKVSYTDWGLKSGVTYKYKVRAINGSSKSVFSKATKKISYMEQVYASARMNEKYDGVWVEWLPTEGAKGYKVYRAEGKDGKFKLLTKGTKFSKHKNDFGTSQYYYNDKNVKKGTAYRYYVIAYNGKIESKYSDDYVATVLYNEYDMIMQTGKVDTTFSFLYRLSEELGESFTATSDNENVVKVEQTTDSNGKKVLSVTAVAPGDAFITMSVKFMGQSMNIGKMKIRVTDEPVYAATIKVGEKFEAGNLDAVFSLIALVGAGDETFDYSLTTDTPDIITVTKDKKGMYYITGKKAGVGNLLFTIKSGNEVVTENTSQVLVKE